MSASWVPPGKQTFVDENGAPLVGGFVHMYVPKGSTRKDTWQDYEQASLNTNPIELDDRGQCMIWGTGAYRQRLTDVDGNEIWDRPTTVGPQPTILAAGTIFGLTLSNNVSTPLTKINVSAGQARDSTNTVDIVLETGISKDLSAVWAVGNNNGMRDASTALAASQSTAIFAILNSNTGVVDVLSSQSATSPSLPAGYDYFRRIGFLPRLGSANRPPSGTDIPAFVQWGDQWLLFAGNNEFTGQSGSTAAQLKDMLLPLGAKVNGRFYAQINATPGAGILRIWDPDQGVVTALGTTAQWGQIRLTTGVEYLTADCQMSSNTAGQIYIEVSNAAATWALKTIGWNDPRDMFG